MDDLPLLFSAVTSHCPSYNVIWRKSAAEILMTLSRHGLTNYVVRYLHGMSNILFARCWCLNCFDFRERLCFLVHRQHATIFTIATIRSGRNGCLGFLFSERFEWSVSNFIRWFQVMSRIFISCWFLTEVNIEPLCNYVVSNLSSNYFQVWSRRAKVSGYWSCYQESCFDHNISLCVWI